MAATSPLPAGDGRVAMRDAMRHRGPDDAGDWTSPDGHVWLAHRRLSIIDLSPAGHQPMLDASGTLAVTFNGEIYNHRALRRELEDKGHLFRSTSDTEVVLAAYREWGDECVDRFVGMFAFAIHDAPERRVFIARDRAGEKPLFYRACGRTLVFASELKAILEHPLVGRQIDPGALDHYLAYGFVPGDRCLIRGMQKLPQGHALSFDLRTGVVRTWRYWELPESDGSDAGIDELADELDALLEDAVRLQLVADVPVGILLSGGIDSTLVTAMAARTSAEPVRTFTVSFPGHATTDEGPQARRIAQHFGTNHTELVADETPVDILLQLARQYDEPIADSSMIPTHLVSRLIREHATVALGGDGSDELFGGYAHHRSLRTQERLRPLVPRAVRDGVAGTAAARLPNGVKGRIQLIRFGGDRPDSIANHGIVFDRVSRQRLLAPLGPPSGAVRGMPEAEKAALCGRGTAMYQARAADFRSYLVDDILVKVDRASMLASLEVRAPFLDHRIIEFAFRRLPDRLTATSRVGKLVPRRLAARLVPSDLVLARKRGFSPPLSSWFRGRWGDYLDSVVAECDPQLFDRRVVEDLVAAQRRGRWNAQRLFAILMFELWRREYRIDTAPG